MNSSLSLFLSHFPLHLNHPSSPSIPLSYTLLKLFLSILLIHPQLDLARKLEKIAAEKGVQLFLASDVIVADKFAPDANNKVVQK